MSGYKMGPKKFSEYSSEFPNLRVEQQDGTASLRRCTTVGRRHALRRRPASPRTTDRALYEISRDNDARAVILTGAGGAWIDGINFGEGTPPSLPPSAFVGMDNESQRFLMNRSTSRCR